MKVIVGLGNPGQKYAATRHNVGFWVIDALAEAEHTPVLRARFQSLVGECRLHGEQVLLLKPQTFMNLSGLAVQDVVHYYKLQPETDLIVVYDDMDFQPGQVKLRERGSAGGHNGMKSIIASLGTEAFCRVRMGIGRPSHASEILGHVLGTFVPGDAKKVDAAVKVATDAILYSVQHGFAKAMNRFN